MSAEAIDAAGPVAPPSRWPERRIFLDPDLDAALRRDGYVVVDGLGSDQVTALRTLADELYPGRPDGFHSSLQSADHAYRSRVFAEVPPHFAALASDLFDRLEPFAASLTLKWPGEASELVAHQDWTMVDERQFRTVNIWCPLVDTGATNGALSVLPGSHRVLNHLRCSPANPVTFVTEETSVRFDEMDLVPVAAGQLVIFDHALLHGSAANLSGEPRPTVTVAYRPAEATLHHYYVSNVESYEVEDFEVEPSFFQEFTIGCRPQQEPVRTVPFYGVPMRRSEILEACGRPVVDAPADPSEAGGTADGPRTFVDDALEQEFRRDGYVVIDLLTPDQVSQLGELVDDLFTGEATGFHATNMLPIPAYREAVWDAVRPVLEPIVLPFFDDHEACTAALMIKFPGEDSGFIAHQDWSLVDETAHRSANVWCPLVETGAHNGGFRVLPGSHRVLHAVRCSPAPPAHYEPPGWQVPLEDLQLVPVRPGQAVVFDHALLHGSEPNRSDDPRPAVTLAVKPRGAQLQHWFAPDLATDRLEVYAIDPSFLAGFELGKPPSGAAIGAGTFVPDALNPSEVVARSRAVACEGASTPEVPTDAEHVRSEPEQLPAAPPAPPVPTGPAGTGAQPPAARPGTLRRLARAVRRRRA